LFGQGVNLAIVGQLDRALAMCRRALELEPFVPAMDLSTSHVAWLNGDTDAAMKLMQDVPSSVTDPQYSPKFWRHKAVSAKPPMRCTSFPRRRSFLAYWSKPNGCCAPRPHRHLRHGVFQSWVC